MSWCPDFAFRVTKDGLDPFKTRCAELMPFAAELLDKGLTDPAQINFARYADGGSAHPP